MADNNFARSAKIDPEFLNGDDPLAELARIVGLDMQVAAKIAEAPLKAEQEPAPAAWAEIAQAPAPRPSPVFDLEEELMREFERYDVPRTAAAAPAAVVEQPLPAHEPEIAEPDHFDAVAALEAELEAAPLLAPSFEPEFQEQLDVAEVAAEPEDRHAEEPAAHAEAFVEPEAVVEPEPLVEPEAFSQHADSLATEALEDVMFASADADLLAEFSGSADAQEPTLEELFRQQKHRMAEIAPVEVADELQAEESQADAEWEPVFAAPDMDLLAEFDLDEELKGEPVAVEAAAVAEPAPLSFDDSIARELEQSIPETVSVVREAVEEPRSAYAEWKMDRLSVKDGPVQAPAPAWRTDPAFLRDQAEIEPVVAEPVQKVIAAEAAPVAKRNAAVASFSLGRTTSFPVVTPVPQSFGLDDLLAEVERYPVPQKDFTPVAEPVAAVEAAAPVVAEPVVEAVAPVVEADVVPRFEPMAYRAEPEAEALAVEAPVTQDTAAEPVAAMAAPEADDPFADMDFELDLEAIEIDLQASAADEPVLVEADKAAYAVGRQPAVQSSFDAVADSVPQGFDPSQLSESDDVVVPIAELDVPTLPVDEKDEPIALPPDYDIDLDTEMGRLFQNGEPGVAKAGAADSGVDHWASIVASVTPQVQAGSNGASQMDEFERGLEEDFRRSLTEPRPIMVDLENRSRPVRPAYVSKKQQRSSGWVLPLGAAAAVVLVAAGSTYAWMNWSSSTATTSDGPRIIAADTDPVKIVPEDRGGKTMPNQDKAVYDKVAGNSVDDPKQKALVSSTEEPVDVVQNTLIPETLPEDVSDDQTAAVTPTEDTKDPRLMSDAEKSASQKTSKVPAKEDVGGVAARKVKTMIVKADGTLVPREDTADEPAAATETAKVETVPATAKPADTAADDAADAKVIDAVGAKPETAVADTPAVDTAAKPVETAKAEIPADDVAAAIADPADPAAVDTDARLAATPDAADATDENGDAIAPVRKVKTTSITGKAPVPATRPADQEVNVVGTVTDQGTVKSSAAAETTQAAAEQPAEKPVEVAAVAPGSYVIQIASLPSEADAQKSYANLAKKFGGVIGGRGVDIKKAEISGKGTFYRVRIPAGSKAEAAELCAQYKAAGGTCLVSK